jgi:hypothetical protein
MSLHDRKFKMFAKNDHLPGCEPSGGIMPIILCHNVLM